MAQAGSELLAAFLCFAGFAALAAGVGKLVSRLLLRSLEVPRNEEEIEETV